MKRWIAFSLALMLCLSAASALAADYPIEEKFYQQMLQSAYKATITFSAEGEETAAFSPSVWALIRTLAPRITLEGDHSLMRGEGQVSLRLLADGEVLGESRYLYNDDLMGFGSDLLAGKDVYYAAAQGWDLSALFASPAQSAWPSLWPALLLGSGASEKWHERLDEALVSYETKLGVWMNGYAAFAIGNDNGAPYTQLSCKIPAQALKAEIKQLLVDFYEDAALLSLLKEALSPEQSAAYLQPASRDAIFTLLDDLQLNGDIEITRRYDAQGQPLLDEISLPFAENQSLSRLTISVKPDVAGQCWQFAGLKQDGTEFDISCIVGENSAYSGSVYLLLPKQEEETSFVVSENAPAPEEIAFDYNLTWEPGEETYTLATKRCERIVQGTLVIKPREGSNMPAQSLSLTASFSSGTAMTTATTLNAALIWRDLDSDASITMQLTSKTAAPFAVHSLDDQDSLVRIDQTAAESYPSLLEYWQQLASQWTQSLIFKLFPNLGFSTPQNP